MKITSGMIVIWQGNAGSIPAGYFRCDGNNGTPDLRDRYPFCGDFVQPAGAVSGSFEHSHPFSGFDHYHQFGGGMGLTFGSSHSNQTTNQSISGSADTEDSTPPSIGLHYVMKA
jgi:hypothetical protein